MHYPPPNSPTRPGTTVPRALTPLAKPSKQSATSRLTTINRRLVPGWTCSTHVFRGATPRESLPPGPRAVAPSEMTKAERRAQADAKFDHITRLRREVAMGSRVEANNNAMWIVANRYVPDKPRASAVTLVLAHATGFHKEIWETTLRFLVTAGGIDEIWSLDAANHGDSALLNKDSLGDIYEWSDHARDILSFLTYYLPDRIDNPEPSLVQIPDQTSQRRLEHGFANRTVIGIGHSFGGCTIARAAIEFPKLFSSLVLVDPVIFPSYAPRGPGIEALIKGALSRRDQWANRESAQIGFAQSAFFKAWHPDVLADYIQHGITEDDQTEAVSFGENMRLPCEVWELLPTLDERVSVKWIMDSTDCAQTGGPELTQHTVWRRPANSTNIQIKGAGHLIPQEAPEALAREILGFIRKDGVKSKL
ncbi:unnamed protein product [Rhizoctonia solani]|uniref:AB hydrolase-1 domain-containing protein n=1 Tax=Rhizoctonia solani TaxID=456999 RepID=A0A8H3HU24_9AGAM|nr:unnamed protein product [Rhizoctonia solani]